MLTTSVAGTVLGLYLLISYHLREILILSEVKNNQLRASTIAELTAENLQVESSNVMAVAEQLSGLITNPTDSVLNEAYVAQNQLESRIKGTSSYALEYTMS